MHRQINDVFNGEILMNLTLYTNSIWIVTTATYVQNISLKFLKLNLYSCTYLLFIFYNNIQNVLN